jgi:dTDP-4-amino-4,6-dideoxygalactose transaminase
MAHFERLALLRNFGIVNEDEVRGVGVNGKLSELHAALGLAMFEPAARETEARAQLAASYRVRLEKLEGILFQRVSPDTQPNHAYFTIEIDAPSFGLSRDQVHEALRADNIFARKYFSPLCSENPSYRDIPTARRECLPHAHRLASRILCLPNHGDLGRNGAERVVEALIGIQAHAPALRRAVGATQ